MEPTDPQPLAAPAEAPRLAAVVFTDVVGYSALMQRDEAGTIAAVSADLSRMSEVAARHGGETLNTMGDGMMLAFPSAVQAVTFAWNVQQAFAERNRAAGESGGLRHRVGIHLGDVYRTPGGQLAGDGVNIAARLEGNAPKGGICISQTVYDTVKGKVPVAPVFAGRHSFKNIAEPIPVWHLAPEGVALPPPAGSPRAGRRAVLAGASAAGLALAGGAGWWAWQRSGAGPASAGAEGQAKSIAVLPFANLSDDKESSYFADGMHEDLLTQLALLGQLKVVSRSSVLEYRKSTKKIPQIAGELNVGSLVEGSVRRAGDMIRVNAQLVDGRTDKHIWAAKYDRELKDVFKVQGELATEIARALNVSLTAAENLRLSQAPPAHPQAYELFLRHEELVRNVAGGMRAISTVKERVDLLEQAVALDPSFALAWARLGAEHARARGYGIDLSVDHQPLARRAIDRAFALAPADPQVRIQHAAVLLHAFDDQQGAIREYETVLAAAPYNIEALNGLAEAQNELGRAKESVAALERVLGVDARNATALTRLAGTYGRYRHYDKVLQLRRRIEALRPEDIDLQATTLLWQYWQTGSWDAYDAWRARQPKDADRRFTRVRNNDADRAIARRDWAEVRRLTDVDSDDYRKALGDSQGVDAVNLVYHALIWLAAGEAGKARAGAAVALHRLDKVAAARKDDQDLHLARAHVLAMLGRGDAAWAAFRQSIAALEVSGNQYMISLSHQRAAQVHALIGQADEALALLRAHSSHPGFFVHDHRVQLAYSPLWALPAFQAFAADPATNQPLPLDTPFTRGSGR